MTLSFFLLLLASLIFSYLGNQAKRSFQARVRALLPRNVLQNHVRVLFADFPERLPAFRSRALPVRAGRLALDALSCITLVVGLWVFPPVFLKGFDLALLRFAGLGLVSVACAVDTVAFGWMAYRTWRVLGTVSQKPAETPVTADAESKG